MRPSSVISQTTAVISPHQGFEAVCVHDGVRRNFVDSDLKFANAVVAHAGTGGVGAYQSADRAQAVRADVIDSAVVGGSGSGSRHDAATVVGSAY